ncbi:unnamed protein product [Polarella glacialis]|uniref:Uncharacterized protein n=1 Tax=Polarella glacialis TaxID=89957 RepID=A0A813LUL4_POLGL|nr:unnamed protein product [Polarella glacialis]
MRGVKQCSVPAPGELDLRGKAPPPSLPAGSCGRCGRCTRGAAAEAKAAKSASATSLMATTVDATRVAEARAAKSASATSPMATAVDATRVAEAKAAKSASATSLMATAVDATRVAEAKAAKSASASSPMATAVDATRVAEAKAAKSASATSLMATAVDATRVAEAKAAKSASATSLMATAVDTTRVAEAKAAKSASATSLMATAVDATRVAEAKAAKSASATSPIATAVDATRVAEAKAAKSASATSLMATAVDATRVAEAMARKSLEKNIRDKVVDATRVAKATAGRRTRRSSSASPAGSAAAGCQMGALVEAASTDLTHALAGASDGPVEKRQRRSPSMLARLDSTSAEAVQSQLASAVSSQQPPVGFNARMLASTSAEAVQAGATGAHPIASSSECIIPELKQKLREFIPELKQLKECDPELKRVKECIPELKQLKECLPEFKHDKECIPELKPFTECIPELRQPLTECIPELRQNKECIPELRQQLLSTAEASRQEPALLTNWRAWCAEPLLQRQGLVFSRQESHLPTVLRHLEALVAGSGVAALQHAEALQNELWQEFSTALLSEPAADVGIRFATVPAKFWVGKILSTPRYTATAQGLAQGRSAWERLSEARALVHRGHTNRHTSLAKRHSPAQLSEAWGKLREVYLDVWEEAGHKRKLVDSQLQAGEHKMLAQRQLSCRVRTVIAAAPAPEARARARKSKATCHDVVERKVMQVLARWARLATPKKRPRIHFPASERLRATYLGNNPRAEQTEQKKRKCTHDSSICREPLTTQTPALAD